MGINLENNEFQNALELIQNSNQTFFLTGKAGTGKSTFLRHIIETVSKKFVVVAPTGIAAVNVEGVTIHSFFSFPLRPLLPNDHEIMTFSKGSEKRSVIEAMDTLIIDEISMVRVDIIDAIDCSLRRNGGDPNLPFGGKQVVFVGDVFQLEPVTTNKTGEYEIIKEIYGNPYFFNAKVFEKINFFTIELLNVYRQTDLEFINLLDKVRIKEVSQIDLDKINTRLISENVLINNEYTITLSTTNAIANQINTQKLIEINTPLFTYNAEISGVFEESKYPTDAELNLKVGAQVVFIKNDYEKRWFNGTIGKIEELADKKIIIKLEDGNTYVVETMVWDNIKFQYNRILNKIESEVIGTFQQYPLKLAWAITIHKSQGLTFDKIIIDFGRGAFASGQAYVALSRARTIKGLFLKRRIFTTDIIVHNEVKEFAKSYNNENAIEESIKHGKELSKNKDIVKEIFIKNPELFIDSICKFYPLKRELIEKYQNSLDWYKLTSNETLKWSIEFIEKFEDKLIWPCHISGGLRDNPSLPWSLELYEKFEEKWDWFKLSENESFPWNLELIEKFEELLKPSYFSSRKSKYWSIEFIEQRKEKWDWTTLSKNESLPWSIEFIERYENKWDWLELSNNKAIPWTIDYIEKHLGKVDWITLSSNEWLPWSIKIIEKYEEKWDWVKLSINESIPFTIEFIENHIEKLDLIKLCNNNAIPWTIEFIDNYKNKWNWTILSQNKSLPWSIDLIEKFEDKWDWVSLSKNDSIPWSIKLIEKYQDKWNWEELSMNSSLPCSFDLITKFENKWKWRYDVRDSFIDLGYHLSGNHHLPWSPELIYKFENRLALHHLSWNYAMPWSITLINKYASRLSYSIPIWKTLQPYINDEMIEDVFKKIESTIKADLDEDCCDDFA